MGLLGLVCGFAGMQGGIGFAHNTYVSLGISDKMIGADGS